MTPTKIIGTILIIIAVLMIGMSFGHEYTTKLTTATLIVDTATFEVTPGSEVVVTYNKYSIWSIRPWKFNLYGNGIDLWSPTVNIEGYGTYYGSFTINAPNTPGTYTYTIAPHAFMPESNMWIACSPETVTITVIDSQPIAYTLTTRVIDDNSNPLSGAEVSIETGVIGTTDSSGTVIKSDMTIGPWAVTATKEGYNSDSTSVSMTADKTVTLQLILIEEQPTEQPTEIPTEIPTGDPTPDPTEWPTGDPTPDLTVQPPESNTYNFVIEILDSNDLQKPIADVKVMINGITHYSDIEGKVTYISDPGEVLDVVITKDGYNRFQKTYTITSNDNVKITLAPSGGDHFLDLDLEEDNAFYDPEGLFGVIPIWLAVLAALFFITGAYLVLKKEEKNK